MYGLQYVPFSLNLRRPIFDGDPSYMSCHLNRTSSYVDISTRRESISAITYDSFQDLGSCMSEPGTFRGGKHSLPNCRRISEQYSTLPSNVKGQRYTLDDRTFVNYAEILGENLYLTASGKFDDVGPSVVTTSSSTSASSADSVTTQYVGVTREKKTPFEAIASLFRSNDDDGTERPTRRRNLLLPTPYDYSATVTRASVVLLGKYAFDVVIEGTGTVRVLYADPNLRIFQSPEDTNVTKSRGLIVVQARVDLVYDDWIDRL
ncbi:hypothetical protein ACHAW5_000125 [Stephanodiscus triporus]|uniref:Galectin n=1 Tax=Stephanodiscus triporus TaxID=2934178 RepID=A0ABD3MK44_9STRA